MILDVGGNYRKGIFFIKVSLQFFFCGEVFMMLFISKLPWILYATFACDSGVELRGYFKILIG